MNKDKTERNKYVYLDDADKHSGELSMGKGESNILRFSGLTPQLTDSQRQKLNSSIKIGVYKELFKMRLLTQEQLTLLVLRQTKVFACADNPAGMKKNDTACELKK